MISFPANTVLSEPSLLNFTPIHFLFSKISPVTIASVSILTFFLFLARERKVRAVDPLKRPLLVICEYPTPSGIEPLRSWLLGYPA